MSIPESPPVARFARPGHDHRRCVEAALASAADLCRRRGARLTGTRQRILELVWAEHRPVGAYELLAALGESGRSAAPPTVYRALDFLLAQGLVHRIESLNAFVGCPAPGQPHRGQFLICHGCGASAELHDPKVDGAIRRSAGGAGFSVERSTVEVLGLCPQCGDRPASADDDSATH
ncbi:MAG: transcriptional repressor [Alphaproteobacteria bacterium]|nr:transcriptional repressor [Alphaproteobacteria bacterium]